VDISFYETTKSHESELVVSYESENLTSGRLDKVLCYFCPDFHITSLMNVFFYKVPFEVVSLWCVTFNLLQEYCSKMSLLNRLCRRLVVIAICLQRPTMIGI